MKTATNASTVTVTFPQQFTSTSSGSQPITDYVIRRINAGGATQSDTQCTSATVTCTETAVPDGTWRYQVLDRIGTNWIGAPGTASSSVTLDTTGPTASLTYSPTGAVKSGTSLLITATFNEPIANSPVMKVAISGANTLAATNMTKVDSTHYTYTHTVGAGDGTATVALSTGTDVAGNVVTSTPTSGATFTVDNTPPTVTIDQTGAQADPTNVTSPINFAVVFSETTTNFATGDVTVTKGTGVNGTATATVTGSGTNYSVAVTGLSGNGTVTATIAAGVATDAAGNGNAASTSTDNTVVIDTTSPTAAITYSPTGAVKSGTSLLITATFNEPVADSPVMKIAITGQNTQAATTMTKVDSTHYTYTHTVGSGNGSATVALSAGTDVAGNPVTAAPTSGATFTVDNTSPTAAITYSPTGAVKSGTSLLITATFNEPVADSPVMKIAISGANTVAATTMTKVDSTHYTYTHTVGSGNGSATVALGAGTDVAGNPVTAAPTSGASFTVDNTPPTVTIDRSSGQADPTNVTSSISFTVNFSETTTNFTTGDVTIDKGTTTGTPTATVSGSGTLYSVSVTGLSGNGTVTATIAAGVATDSAGNDNTASTSTDNDVVLDTTAPTAAITYSPTGPVKSGTSLLITATFSEAMGNSPLPKIAISGSNTVGATNMTKVDSTHYTYTHTVAAGNGTATVALSVGTDLAGNPVTSAPTSGATFTVDNTGPTAAITYSTSNPVKSGASLTITATFNEPVADSPVMRIAISGANTVAATDMTKVDTTHYTYTHTVASGNGAATVALSVGSDLAGNPVTSTPTSGATFTVDNTAPSLTSVDAANGKGTVGQIDTRTGNGGPDTLTFTYNEAIDSSSLTTGNVNVVFTDGGGSANDTITVPGVGTVDLGSKLWLTATSTKQESLSVSGSVVTLTITTDPTGNASGIASSNFTWSATGGTAADVAGNKATGSVTTNNQRF